MNSGKRPPVSEAQIERWRREDEAGMEFTGEVLTFDEAMRRGRPKSDNPRRRSVFTSTARPWRCSKPQGLVGRPG